MKAPKSVEEIGPVAKLKPIPIVEGVLHMHWLRITGDVFSWVAKRRRVEGLCGTERCAVLTVIDRVQTPRCEHVWKPVEPLTFHCNECDEYRVMKVQVS